MPLTFIHNIGLQDISSTVCACSLVKAAINTSTATWTRRCPRDRIFTSDETSVKSRDQCRIQSTRRSTNGANSINSKKTLLFSLRLTLRTKTKLNTWIWWNYPDTIASALWKRLWRTWKVNEQTKFTKKKYETKTQPWWKQLFWKLTILTNPSKPTILTSFEVPRIEYFKWNETDNPDDLVK
jgi:hypothetical protein